MTFLHSTLALAGIACIAIPIIIHLLMHRRRKPVMWGAMRFLLEAYRRQRRRLMIEKWILLACRCLVIALLGLAIGRPLIGRLLGPGAGRTLYILIDNSLTSGLRGPDGRTALERHKQTAAAAIDALRSARIGGALGVAPGSAEGDRVALITLGGPAEGQVMPPSADLAAVARLIDELEPTDSRADITGGLQLVADALAGIDPTSDAALRSGSPAPSTPDRTYLALISDFREGSLDLSPAAAAASPPRLPEGVTLLATVPADATPATNTLISGVEPLRAVVVSGDASAGAPAESTGGDNLVRVMLRRSGENLGPASSTVQARLIWPAGLGPSGSPAQPSQPASTQAAVKWAQGQDSAMIVASLPRAPLSAASASGSLAGAILVSIDDDAVSGDNAWRRPVEFREALRVGVIAPTRFAARAGWSADKLDPGAWARIALAPASDAAADASASGIDVIDIEPASIDAARLAGLDAVVLPRPDLIQDSGWARIGLFASGGGVVLVTPPPDVSVHLWSDAMVKGLGLPADWSLGRETRNVTGTHFVAASSSAGASASPTAPASTGIASGLLALVEGELDGLLRPVNITTALPLDSTGDSGQAILKLDNGATILWAGRPAAPAAGGGVGGGGGESRGLIVYLGVALSLDWSDLPAKPFMVPLMQEIVRQGVGQARGSWWMIAGSRPSAPAGVTELRPIDERSDRTRAAGAPIASPRAAEIIPLKTPSMIAAAPPLHTALRHAGAFAAVDDRGSTRAVVAVNPDPRAGRIQPQPRDAVARFLATSLAALDGAERVGQAGQSPDPPDAAARAIVWLPADSAPPAPALDPGAATSASDSPTVQSVMSGLFGSSERGSPIELPLLIAALVLAIVEIGLARWASHAEVLPAAVRQAAGAMTAGVVGGAGAPGEAA